MNIGKVILYTTILGLATHLNIKTADHSAMPAILKTLQTQETALEAELLNLSDSTLQKKKIELVAKIAQVKIDRQSKGTKESSSSTNTSHWNNQIAITSAVIEGLQDLLQREADPRLNPAKIYKDLKNEYLLLQQEPDSRNQSLES